MIKTYVCSQGSEDMSRSAENVLFEDNRIGVVLHNRPLSAPSHLLLVNFLQWRILSELREQPLKKWSTREIASAIEESPSRIRDELKVLVFRQIIFGKLEKRPYCFWYGGEKTRNNSRLKDARRAA